MEKLDRDLDLKRVETKIDWDGNICCMITDPDVNSVHLRELITLHLRERLTVGGDMTFVTALYQVRGMPQEAIIQVPEALKEDSKRILGNKSPEEITAIVIATIKEIIHGAIEPLDTLIKKRL